jgi:L-malate glycosyltransferase
MRVLHLIKSMGRGGAETLLASSHAASRTHGVEPSYGYFLPWKSAVADELRQAGATVTCFPATSTARMAARLFDVAHHIRRAGVDVVHCHLPSAASMGRIAARIVGVPVVYTEHNLQERYHPFTRAANLATWTAQDHVIAVSDEVRRSIPPATARLVPVTVIENGVDTGRFQRNLAGGARVRHELGIDDGAPVVGTVAVFRRQKRLDVWLAAAARIADVVPGARFILVGDGPERQALAALGARLTLTGRLHFVGLRIDVRDYLSAMDVFVSSSAYEGMPVAMLEAMACGLPVVATRVAGNIDVVDDGATGLLVDEGDPDALARSAIAALQPGAASVLGENARRVAEQRFSTARMSAELADVYRSVVSDHR